MQRTGAPQAWLRELGRARCPAPAWGAPASSFAAPISSRGAAASAVQPATRSEVLASSLPLGAGHAVLPLGSSAAAVFLEHKLSFPVSELGKRGTAGTACPQHGLRDTCLSLCS